MGAIYKSKTRTAQSHWVYRCYDGDGGLLYIGVTSCGLARFATGHGYYAVWWPEVARIEIDHLPTREAALLYERTLIADLEPMYNIVHAGELGYIIPDSPPPTNWLTAEALASWLDAEPGWVEVKVKQGMPHMLLSGDMRFKAQAVTSWLRASKR